MIHPADLSTVIAASLRIAACAVVADIQSNCTQRIDAQGQRWWDCAAWCHPDEVGNECADMARQTIDYAISVGIATPHSTRCHLIRLTPQE